jgi:hypothetical protein
MSHTINHVDICIHIYIPKTSECSTLKTELDAAKATAKEVAVSKDETRRDETEEFHFIEESE